MREIVKANLSEQVYDVLRDMLLDGKYAFGERLLDFQIARDIGVSRTPVREALLRLEEDGLLVSAPGGAKRVVTPTEKDVRETFEIRGLLETFALTSVLRQYSRDELMALCDELAAIEVAMQGASGKQFAVLDNKFHDRIVRSAGNSRLAKIWESIQTQVLLFRVCSASNRERVEAAKKSHSQIISAMRMGRETEAVRLLAEHIDFAKIGALKSLQQISPDDQTG